MPTIFEWIDRLSFLRGLPGVYLLLVTAVFIVFVGDWRLMLLAFAGQYLVAGLLFVEALDPRLAIVKVLAGWFVCLILYMTGRQADDGGGGNGRSPANANAARITNLGQGNKVRGNAYRLLSAISFRLVAALIILLSAWVLSQRPGYFLLALPSELAYMTFAVYGLIGLGLLGVSLTADPLRAGLGVLMLMTGFELYYSVLEQSVVVLALLAAVNLILALAISYLTQARYVRPLLEAEE